jgi:hypothetical protein
MPLLRLRQDDEMRKTGLLFAKCGRTNRKQLRARCEADALTYAL